MILSILTALSVSFSPAAHALPLPTSATATMQLPASLTDHYDFEGIVSLSNCSGALVQLEGAKDTDFGLILSNGHCLESGFPEPGTFVFKRPSSRTFGLLGRDAQRVGTVNATEIVYATMTKTDMSIYRLRETYAEIKTRFGIRPLTLSSIHPETSVAVEVISGYWQRGYSCNIDTFVNTLKEENYVWKDSIRYTQPGCETIGGTSGSPLVLAGTKTVVDVNNTGNEDGEECTMNNPCEVDSEGRVTYKQGHSYAQETYWVYSCLNDARNDMEISRKDCQLPH